MEQEIYNTENITQFNGAMKLENKTHSTKDTISKLKISTGKTFNFAQLDPYAFSKPKPMKNSEIKSSTKITELDLYSFYTIRNTPAQK